MLPRAKLHQLQGCNTLILDHSKNHEYLIELNKSEHRFEGRTTTKYTLFKVTEPIDSNGESAGTNYLASQPKEGTIIDLPAHSSELTTDSEEGPITSPGTPTLMEYPIVSFCFCIIPSW